MANLVNTLEILKKHVTLNASFKIETLNPHIKKQERKHIKPLLGTALFESISAAPAGSIKADLLELLHEASSNLAMLSYSTAGVVDISNAGFLKSNTEHAVAASWTDLKDMRRFFLKTGMEALDEALELMEDNEALFPEWKDTAGYTNFKELLTRKTQTFQRYFNIEKSRLTFLRLRPHLLRVEEKYFKGLLGLETLLQIKAEASAEAKEALRISQAAQVPLCVAEIVNEGAFLLTPKGMFFEIDEIPGERKIKLEEKELQKVYDAKTEEGNEQLKNLVNYLKSKPEVFVAFASKEKNEIPGGVFNTKSIISF